MQNMDVSTHEVLEILRFEKRGNLIGWEPFSKYLENQIFPRHAVFAGLCRTLSWINLENFRNIWLVSKKNTKNHIFWHFSLFFTKTRFFYKNSGSVTFELLSISNFMWSFKKILRVLFKKNVELIITNNNNNNNYGGDLIGP